MEGISEKITNIEDKLQRLSIEVQRLRAENARLRIEQVQNEGGLLGNPDHKGKGAAPKKKLDWEKSAAIKKLKKDIDQYMREVDKCIDWLQKS